MWHITIKDMPACRKVTATSHLLLHCHIPPLTPVGSLPHPTPTPRARARIRRGQLGPHPAGGRDQVSRPEPRTPAGGHSPGVSGPGGLRSPVRAPVSTHALQGPGVTLPRTTRHPPGVCPGGAVWCAGYSPIFTCISRYFHETLVPPAGEVVSPYMGLSSPPTCHFMN